MPTKLLWIDTETETYGDAANIYVAPQAYLNGYYDRQWTARVDNGDARPTDEIAPFVTGADLLIDLEVWRSPLFFVDNFIPLAMIQRVPGIGTKSSGFGLPQIKFHPFAGAQDPADEDAFVCASSIGFFKVN